MNIKDRDVWEEAGLKVLGFSGRRYIYVDGNIRSFKPYEVSALCPNTEEWNNLLFDELVGKVKEDMFITDSDVAIVRECFEVGRSHGRTKFSCLAVLFNSTQQYSEYLPNETK